jgi:hypothetical protein
MIATAMDASAISGLTTPRIPGNFVEGNFSLADMTTAKILSFLIVGIIKMKFKTTPTIRWLEDYVRIC